MSEYTDCINKLLDVYRDMTDKADYTDLELICHKRISVMDNAIFDCLFLMFYEYGYISAYEYEELQDKRIEIHNNYTAMLNGRRIR